MEIFAPIFGIAVYTFILWIFGCLKFENPNEEKGTPKMINPPPPPEKREEELKALYEHLRTRAFDFEGVKEANPIQAFPLWINIDEIYYVLSMYHNREFMDFLKEHGLCYDDGFGCEADDHKLPEFPAEKSNRYD
jgi:hypothetical protein